MQYGIHVCTFEDLIVNDVIIKGMKDGVHLGRGKRFTISNGVFQTFDDAIALNAHDYSTGNPELGWIENGVVENCHDLTAENTTGYFCRILAGAWIDWKPGMKVQQSDAVVSNGKIYRVQAQPDGTVYTSNTQPTHESGKQMLDGINWGVVQTDTIHTCGVRNVIFRNLFLEKPRIGLSIHFDNDKFSRSYYPGAQTPVQEQLTFDNVRVLHDKAMPFLNIGTPVDVVTITNSSIRNNKINVYTNKALTDYLKTHINIFGCVFNQNGPMTLISNNVDGKEIVLKTFGNIEINKGFSATITPGNGKITVESDLTGLKK
jgi:polygalacturonase